jgi:predicted Zn-dependent peptidase
LNKRRLENNPLNYGTVSKEKLSNGITLITNYESRVNSFALCIGIKAGSRHDPPGLEGMAHFAEHAAFRHTRKKTSRGIATAFESVGADTNAFTTQEYTCFYTRALKNHFNKVFDNLAELTFNPVYYPNEIDKERQVIISEINSYNDDPEEMIAETADSLIFTGGLAHSITGTDESVKRIGTTELLDFHGKFYRPENCVITIAGNIKHELAAKKLESIPAGRFTKTPLETGGYLDYSKLELRRPYTQAHLHLAMKAGHYNHQNSVHFAIFNTILGDGLSSRLYQGIRERKGLAYTIYSGLQQFSDSGIISIYAGCEEPDLIKAERAIIGELKKLRESGIKPAELKRAKEQLKSSMLIESESMTSTAQYLLKNEILDGPGDTLEDKINEINSVDLDSMNEFVSVSISEENVWELIFLPE